MNLGQRIRHHRKRIKKNQTELAEMIGVSQDSISNWETMKREPSMEDIGNLAGAFGISIHDLIPEQSQSPDQKNSSEAPGTTEDGYITLPRLNICPSAGAGTITEEEMPVDFVRFKEDWLRTVLRLKPENLNIVSVDGDSMEPTLRSGDLIIVDCRTPDSIKDGVYVIRHDGALKVKRLQGLGKGSIKITSDNPRYDPITVGPDSPPEEFSVCGRVVWAGRRM